MHPSSTSLVAFCDAETGAFRSRLIEKHLSKCEKCRTQLRLIQGEKDELSATHVCPDMGQDWTGILSVITAWRNNPANGAAAELKLRLRSQIETYLGPQAIAAVETPGATTEALLEKTGEILDTLLGPNEADAIRDDLFRGLDWTETAGEVC